MKSIFLNSIVIIAYVVIFATFSFMIALFFYKKDVFNLILSFISIISFVISLVGLVLSINIKNNITIHIVNKHKNEKFYNEQKMKFDMDKKESNDFTIEI
ncbi:hypothetical protein BFL38_09725 [Brachyspira hampsonii]|uniref:Uncharacterized protein n=1 Tax=Brachyspira hampsonii TaxID=1287055 RepID=A0A1E5NHY1_9SPIR|nr:hypothetical protein [Brachyspira hampsonii]OEJ15736.1 hypothetical protein BFL38_09725 [Brachyspira hampsonii]